VNEPENTMREEEHERISDQENDSRHLIEKNKSTTVIVSDTLSKSCCQSSKEE
jgi:C4-type Zn-finger protein